MWEYKSVPNVRSEEVEHVCAQMGKDGWDAHGFFFMRADSLDYDRFNIIFKKASKDISYGQLLINRYGDKLTEVADILGGMRDQACLNLSADIKEFLFKGSPEDM
jgi:hypothetical protein